MLKKVHSYLLAKSYDFAMRNTEKRCLQQWRSNLLSQARGNVLEIGAGTGVNLQHYPGHIAQLTLSEPDPQMRRILQKKNLTTPTIPVHITSWEIETTGMPDSSFDTIVSTLVLCSVPDLSRSLSEIYRLLRPQGTLLFLEHVASDHPQTLHWQRRVEPFWSLCAGNCRLTRDTAVAIQTSGLEIERCIEAPMAGTPSFVRRTIRGSARKA
ncbi:class I SAM-dependent methyltransferase [Desulfuromusa kysingii]|uniref:class I SAM-dependent methyltransferase n=1 Tax=Desulfuromusa kysingii TaxID=37625 RepID=UPI0015877C66|nr:class I SAM-dependent methyltransferase [Desulfuromusa kysingii]